jgi:V-type H+-transporting ATPase subunit d
VQTSTDYGAYLANEAPPLQTNSIVDCCTRRLADVWHELRCNADEPLATFLDYCTYGHMIDNVVLIVTGLLHERDVQARRLPRSLRLFCCPHLQWRPNRACTGRIACNVARQFPGQLHNLRLNARRRVQELKEKCHPLGVFDNMERLAVAANMTELYDLVLRDTPLGHYFSAVRAAAACLLGVSRHTCGTCRHAVGFVRPVRFRKVCSMVVLNST